MQAVFGSENEITATVQGAYLGCKQYNKSYVVSQRARKVSQALIGLSNEENHETSTKNQHHQLI
jgi:hypothetical protein